MTQYGKLLGKVQRKPPSAKAGSYGLPMRERACSNADVHLMHQTLERVFRVIAPDMAIIESIHSLRSILDDPEIMLDSAGHKVTDSAAIARR
jgi:hypothetical protein